MKTRSFIWTGLFFIYIYKNMTKAKLKQLIKECVNEILKESSIIYKNLEPKSSDDKYKAFLEIMSAFERAGVSFYNNDIEYFYEIHSGDVKNGKLGVLSAVQKMIPIFQKEHPDLKFTVDKQERTSGDKSDSYNYFVNGKKVADISAFNDGPIFTF